MNERKARDAVRGRLVFGNDRQIRAVQFLNSLQNAIDVIKEADQCDECDGHGLVEEWDPSDDEQEGPYLETCACCDGLGYFVVDWPVCSEEVLEAAIVKIKNERDCSRAPYG